MIFGRPFFLRTLRGTKIWMAPRGLLLALPLGAPLPCKGGHTIVGAREAQCHQIGVHLLQRLPFLARPASVGLQPARKILCKRVKLARPIRCCELGLDRFIVRLLVWSGFYLKLEENAGLRSRTPR
jgi:hypothetical protein